MKNTGISSHSVCNEIGKKKKRGSEKQFGLVPSTGLGTKELLYTIINC